MKKNLLIILPIAVLLVIIGIISGSGSFDQPRREGNRVTIPMRAQNGSGLSGVAVIEEIKGQAFVTITLAGGTSGTVQPANIHFGSCDSLGQPKYPLTAATGGVSETLLGGTLDQLKTELPLAINVRQSDSEPNANVACGDIRL